jgi:DNA-binding NtrC family response regulator
MDDGEAMSVLLVVDSGEGELAEDSTRALAGQAGIHTIIERKSGRAAISALEEGLWFDLAMVEDRPADMETMELLASLRRLAPGLPVIVTSGRPSVEAYLNAFNHGAFEFIARPVSPAYLRRIMTAALEDAARSGRRPAKPLPAGDASLQRPGVSSGGSRSF